MAPILHALAGPWRLLILDTSDADDPRWVLVTVDHPEDVRPARMIGRRYDDWAETTEWTHERLGVHPALVPIAAMVWRVEEQRATT